MSAFEIPLNARPEIFGINIGGVDYKLATYWCPLHGSWILDIMLDDEQPVVMGIPVITGVDLLAPYTYLGISGALYAQTSGDVDAVPTFTNLGVSGRLFLVTP